MGAHPAFGRGVGVRKMKKLWEAFEGDMSMCSDLSNITAVDGFDTKTATKVMLGLPVFDAFLSNLGDLITIQPYEKVVGGAMDGKVVVFTGFRSKDLELAVERAGGKMGSGVSSKTTYVVTENPSDGSTKLTKARELSIPIISVGELRAML
jgi:NAD-dependent DNA ligase